MALTLTQAQRRLLSIIESVELDSITPEDALRDLETLKQEAAAAGLTFRADYSLEDFERIRTAYASTYESSTSYVEPEESIESSY